MKQFKAFDKEAELWAPKKYLNYDTVNYSQIQYYFITLITNNNEATLAHSHPLSAVKIYIRPGSR